MHHQNRAKELVGSGERLHALKLEGVRYGETFGPSPPSVQPCFSRAFGYSALNCSCRNGYSFGMVSYPSLAPHQAREASQSTLKEWIERE